MDLNTRYYRTKYVAEYMAQMAELRKEGIPVLCRTLYLSVDAITRYRGTKYMGMAEELVKRLRVCNVQLCMDELLCRTLLYPWILHQVSQD